MPLTVDTPPEASAIDLEMLKEHLRLKAPGGSYTAEDSILNALIKAGVDAYESRFKTTLVTTTLIWGFEEFSRKMELARPPLASVESVTYIDTSGAEQTVDASDYSVIDALTPGCILFKKGYEFPDLDEDTPYPVSVTYKAGYGADHTKVPDSIRLYIRNIIGTYYMQRESVLVSYTGLISIEDISKSMAKLIAGKPKAMRFG